MKKGVTIGLIVGGVLLLLIIGFFVLANKNNSNNNASNENNNPQNGADVNQMVDCGKITNPSCFTNRMSECLPVTAELTSTDGSPINLIILGAENNTCHFQRKVNNITDMNCYFPKGTLNWSTIDQTFGNDHGFGNVIDENCKTGW
jgi:hypothetical protein